MEKPSNFNPESKAQVVLQLISGEETSAELGRESRISAQQLLLYLSSGGKQAF